mgnify:CR=1 FL=1
MTTQHEITTDPHTTEWVDDNLWVRRELTGATDVSCSCGLHRTVANAEVRQVVEEHRASAA